MKKVGFPLTRCVLFNYMLKTFPALKKASLEERDVLSDSSPASHPSNNTVLAAQEDHYQGWLTVYDQNGNRGACGDLHSDWDKVVAISHERNPVQNGQCGQYVILSYNGINHRFLIADMCPGCDWNSMDLSKGAFQEVTGNTYDMVWAEWWYE